MRIGLAGLGIMGYRIGANLAKAGKLDLVWNRTVGKAGNVQQRVRHKIYHRP